MQGPWSQEQIDRARNVRFDTVLDFMGAFHKRDHDYSPRDPGREGVRVHASYCGRDFRFVITGEKFVNELLSQGVLARGGGGTIDFVRHITGYNFVQAVKICLDAAETTRVHR